MIFPGFISTVDTQSSEEALLWLLLLLAMVLIGGFVVLAIRRRYRGGDVENLPATFSLAALRQMRDRGELTDEEFRRACDHLHRDTLGESSAVSNDTKNEEGKKKPPNQDD